MPARTIPRKNPGNLREHSGKASDHVLGSSLLIRVDSKDTAKEVRGIAPTALVEATPVVCRIDLDDVASDTEVAAFESNDDKTSHLRPVFCTFEGFTCT